MARPFPYTYIACPCTSTIPSIKPEERTPPPDLSEPDSYEESTFDPRSQRSSFSLFPPEHLLYCEDCHQIKCPRCTTEEIVCWFCPDCLFETPSSMVRSEGNRCARNCFRCPICTSPLSINGLENTDPGSLQTYIMLCGYCQWSSLDIGIKFDKPSNIRTQLTKMTSTAPSKSSRKDLSSNSHALSPLSPKSEEDQKPPAISMLSPQAHFSALKSFYKSQISASASPSDPLLGALGTSDYSSYNSPSALNRIMSLYASSTSSYSTRSKPKTKTPVMREALTLSEGLQLTPLPSPDQDMKEIDSHFSTTPWSSIPSLNQRLGNPPATPSALPTVADLLPQPTHLCTKRSKRCLACRHILVKPESKPQATRFRIRLVALSYIPLVTVKPLSQQPSPTPSTPVSSQPIQPINLSSLPPLTPTNLILTLQNHLFDPISITLSTPTITPGRFGHRVTLLCPGFEVGANSDVWEEALNTNTNLALPPSKSRGSANNVSSSESSGAVEAGKIWAKGRNWTSVILEIVPANLQRPIVLPGDQNGGGGTDEGGEWEVEEDEDVVEIPIFVRLEYDADVSNEDQADRGTGADEDGKGVERRELTYWMVLGVGRVAR